MNCATIEELVSAYVDDELTIEERSAVRDHIDSCSDCFDRVERHRALKHALANLTATASPSQAVRSRVNSKRVRRPIRRWHMVAGLVAIASAVASLFVLWAISDQQSKLAPDEEFASELMADHARYAPKAVPAEVSSGDPNVVARFFDGVVPFTPTVPLLQSATLIGGRLCNIGGRNVQLLFYDQLDRRFSLYVTDRRRLDPGCMSDGNHGACTRELGDLMVTLVGDAREEELRELLANAQW